MVARRYQLGSDLRTRIRSAAGYENNTHVSDSELDWQIDQAARLLLDIYLESYGPEPYRSEQLIDLDAGTSIYDLSQDVYQVLGVYAVAIEGIDEAYSFVLPWYQLAPFEEHERLPLLNSTDGRLSRLRYRMGGAGADGINQDRDQIELLPTPTQDGRLKLVYVPTPILAAVGEGDGDVRVFAPGASSEWIVCYGAAFIRSKEKDDPSFFVGKMRAIEEGIRAHASRRDQNEPARMRGRRFNARRNERELDLEGMEPWP